MADAPRSGPGRGDRAPALAVEDVSHRFGDLSVLEDVTLEVASGEVLAIVGPSGCGKSTLLAVMGGLLRPERGEVLAEPAPAGSLNPLTFVFQDFALLPWRNVRDNVALGLEHRGLSAREIGAAVEDALARTKLSDFAGALPKQLSGGMRQRVGIARALAVRPSILLMDEPLSALDGQTREILMEDLSALLAGTPLAVVYVTHNLDEALRLADRIAVFSRRPGRVRRVLAVPVPRARRTDPARAAELSGLRDALWSSIREEAETADRELLHA